jgi:ribosomal protein S24E
MIETVSDVENSFLSRREITCNFQGLGGKLKRKDAVEMITKEFNLTDKTVIAINMKNQTGRPNVTGMFYVYDDGELAKKQVNPTIFERLEKQAKKDAEVAEEAKAEAPAEEAKAEAPAEEAKAEAPAEEAKAEAPAEEAKAEAPAEEEKKE